MARALAASGAFADAQEALDAVAREDSWAGSWLGLEVADRAAERGAVEPTLLAVDRITAPEARRRAWDLVGRAQLEAGDTTAALAAFLSEARRATDDDRRAAAWSAVGRLRLLRADSGAAAQAFRNALAVGRDVEAARGMLELRPGDADVALAVYGILREEDEDALALRALDRYAELVDGPLPDTLRLDRARLLAASDRRADAIRVLGELASLEEADVAAEALEEWADVRRRQDRRGDAREIQDRLVERFPSHPEAVEVVFFRADDRHDRRDFSGALAGYRRAVEMAPDLDRAGLARMRIGQIHLTQDRPREAAEVFEGYLDAFPRGRRWDEARYWAAWTRRELGEEGAARVHVQRIRERDPFSYYAILGSRLLGEDYAPAIPDGTEPPEVPAIGEALDRIRVLSEAGLDEAVPDRIYRLRERYAASDDSLLRLSLELSERGFSLEGITLGWELRRRGRDWDRWLVRAVYPFPYRQLVRLEAEEWGLEPVYLAALIRQESAFAAGARSGAGAMGLMQVVPSTGRNLARSVGPEPFAEHVLLRPEVNLHLGAAFLSRLHERFGERTALVLAAYNAGPSRARRWQSVFPEAEDPLRFTERIPFRETRGYVKRVTRNVELYRWLYGEDL